VNGPGTAVLRLYGRLVLLRRTRPDPELLSLFEHTDFAMRIREAGGSVWREPRALVSYGRPRFIKQRDRAYYTLRWSERWNLASRDRFRTVWRLDNDPYLLGEFEALPDVLQRRRARGAVMREQGGDGPVRLRGDDGVPGRLRGRERALSQGQEARLRAGGRQQRLFER